METRLRTAVLQGNVVSKQNRNGKETRLRTAVLTRRCGFDTISITLLIHIAQGPTVGLGQWH